MDRDERQNSQSTEGASDTPETFEDLFSVYMDKLNEGMLLDPDQIRADHAEWGDALLEALKSFIAFGSEQNEPLGTLGDYTLRRQIGRGGMGVVYEAWQNSVDRRVALKVLPGAVAADERAFQRFMREARAAAKLNHPNVVGVHGMGQEENTAYFAMEYVDGETLAQKLAEIRDVGDEAETPFGPKNRQDYFIRLGAAFGDVAHGLQHAHSKGVIHRDIKPSNLILDSEGRLRILDFGLARLEGQEGITLSGDVVGTPLYMSPEQARQKRIQVDHRTDVYSLGATVYEMLCGRPPFKGKSHQDTLSQIIERDPVGPRKLNQRVPKDLETIVLKCLRKDARDRYGTAEALAQDLRRFVRGDPVEARPETRLEKLARQASRYRSVLFVAAALLILLAALAWQVVARRIAEDRETRAKYDRVVLGAAEVIYEELFLLSSNELSNVHYIHARGSREENGKQKVEVLKETVRKLKEMAAVLPEYPDASFYLARIYHFAGWNEAALDALDQALEAAPDFVPADVLREEIASMQRPVRGRALAVLFERYRVMHGWQEPWLSAYKHFWDREWEQAVEAYGKLLRWRAEEGKEPYLGFAVEAYMGRGLSRLRSRDFAGAIRDFSAARAFWPHFHEAGLLLGKATYQKGEPEEAERVFLELYAECPAEPSNLRSELAVWISRIYGQLGDREKEDAWIDQAEEPEMLYARAFRLGLDGRWEEALKKCQRALELEPQDPERVPYMKLLRYYIQRERYGSDWDREREELLALASRAMRDRPRDPGIRFFEFCLLLLQGRLEEARADAERIRVLQLQAEDRMYWLLARGMLLREEGRFEEAVDPLGRTVDIDPGNIVCRAELARTLEQGGKLPEALAEYEVLKKHGASAVGWAGAARVLNRLEQYKAAEVAARKAVGLFPRNTSAYGSLAYTLCKTNRFQEALAIAEEGLRAVPGRVEPYLARGLAYEGLGDPAAAARSLCEALELHPEYVEAHRALVLLVTRHRDLCELEEVRLLADHLEERASSSGKREMLEQTIPRLRGTVARDSTLSESSAKE